MLWSIPACDLRQASGWRERLGALFAAAGWRPTRATEEVSHLCYVTDILRSGAAAGLRRRWYIPVGYAVVWAGLVTAMWSGLGALQVPVAAYSLLLTGTAVTAAGLGWLTGLGGALFFISDGLIAGRLADLPQPPMPSLWIMSTYIAAQYLLASGVLRRLDRDGATTSD